MVFIMEKIVTSQLTISASLESLESVEEFFLQKLSNIQVSTTQLHNTMVTVTEAVTNAIIHGSKHDARKMIIINLSVNNHALKISVIDSGPGFNPSELEDPTSAENRMKINGRGIFLIRTLANDVKIDTTPNGTTVEFEITLDSER